MTTDRKPQHQDQRTQGGDMTAQLEDVLDAYAAAEPGPRRATLADWVRQYPQFPRELTAFTARWQLLEWTADAELAAEPSAGERDATAGEVTDDQERLVLRGMSAAQSVFYAVRARRQAPRVREAEVREAPARADVPITGLLHAATRAGLSADDLVARAGLSDGLLRKIDRRLMDPATIPVRVLSNLAGALGRGTPAVVAYTQREPVFCAGAQRRANQGPVLPPRREDFFDAVRKDLTLDEARRRELLVLPRPGDDVAGPDDPGAGGRPWAGEG